MRLGEIWDYMMRRKILLLFLFAVSMLGGLGLGHILAKRQVVNSLSYEVARSVNNASSEVISQDELMRMIRQYQASVPDTVLNNKKLDEAKKAQILQAYGQLEVANQAQFTEFIEQIERGGVPEIRFSGQTSYEVGAEIPNFTRMVEIYDNEDGDETGKMSKVGLKVISNFNPDRAGDYYATYTMHDSDGNQSKLTVALEIKATEPVVTPDPGVNERPSIDVPEPVIPSVVPNSPADDSSVGGMSVGGGVNLGDTALASELPTPSRGETTIFDPVSAIEDQVAVDNTATDGPVALLPAENQSRAPSNTTDGDAEAQAVADSGWTIWNFCWIILGALGIGLFIRFIFDHYVR